MKYCTQCGYRLEGEFKYCPNCGSKLTPQSDSIEEAIQVQTDSIIICKNCGEENPQENINCFSCGIPLKGIKSIKSANQKKETSQTKVEIDKTSGQKKVDDGKVFDNRIVLLITSIILVITVSALFLTGVFDTGIQNTSTIVENQSTDSGVDLQNINEIADLEAKVNANPDDMESRLHLAHLQQDARFFEKALTNYKKYLEKYPENSDARVDMGICYYNLKNYTSAIKEMETAITYQPKHQIAHLNLGIVNLTAGNVVSAKEWFKKAMEIDPNSDAGKRAQELLASH
jgi:cytochrome c-type biogenesis protein CcmH/NrfG